MVKKVLQIVMSVALACYPLLIYLGLETLSVKHLAGCLLGLFFIRLWIMGQSGLQFLKRLTLPAACCGLVLAGASFLMNSEQALLYYPVVVSLAGLSAFGFSLVRPPSMIECFARLSEEDLPDEAVTYTRKVTKIWCAFFAINACIALLTVLLGDYGLWALYNGLLSYIFMGSLLTVEWLYRKWVLKV